MSSALPNQLPEVQLTAAPRPDTQTRFIVDFSWSAFDEDGQVERFVYALDPPASGDTAWTSTDAHALRMVLPSTTTSSPPEPEGTRVIARDYHTFAICAVDNRGARSAVVARSFTTRTVAPESVIDGPSPSSQAAATTLPATTIRWHGIDSDRETNDSPVRFKYKFVLATDIQPNQLLLPNPAQVQEYFGRDYATGYADWDSVPGSVTSYRAEGLTPGTAYVFAVVALDEAGAWEPRFFLTSNVLIFRPTLLNLGPKLTITSPYYNKTQAAGGIDITPSHIPNFEVPPGLSMPFSWTAEPNPGSSIAGFRWAIDLANGDITNETPRVDDADTRHWSAWSLSETGATVGPFSGSTDSTSTHFLYVEARDIVGFVSLFVLKFSVIVATFDRPLLVIDDMYGQLGSVRNGSYPTEAEQDTFYCAVGGVPNLLEGGVSEAGAFAGFPYDTLDYRFFGRAGIPLSLLGRYRAVAWYTDNGSSSGNSDFLFGSGKPSNALRYINVSGRLNSLALYLRQGGKAFLFGDGVAPSVANGFWTRVSGSFVPFIPYGSNPANRNNYVLRPGCFLYDFLQLTSELNTAGTSSVQFTAGEQMRGAIPYLPEFRGPGSDADRTHDPRIGPGAERTALRWSGLPQLTGRTFRGANADPTKRTFNLTWHVSKPLVALENGISVLDTLYLLQARDYSGDGTGATSDGKPNGLAYHGSNSGDIVWLGFPLYYFEHDQARQVVRVVMREFGIDPLPASVRSGPLHPDASAQ